MKIFFGILMMTLLGGGAPMMVSAAETASDQYQESNRYRVDFNPPGQAQAPGAAGQAGGDGAKFKSVQGLSEQHEAPDYQEGGVKTGGVTPNSGTENRWKRRHESRLKPKHPEDSAESRLKPRHETGESRLKPKHESRLKPKHPGDSTESRLKPRHEVHEDRHKPLRHPARDGQDFGKIKADGNKIGDHKFGGGTDQGTPKTGQLSPSLKALGRNGQRPAGAVTLNGLGKAPPGPPNSPARSSVNPGPPGLSKQPPGPPGSKALGNEPPGPPQNFTGGVKPR